MDLKGKTVVVTGAGRGAGRAIALALAQEGAFLVLAARTEKQLDGVLNEVIAIGPKAIAVPTDLSDPEQVKNLAAQTLKVFGTVDIIVNNAGWCPPLNPVQDTPLEHWDFAMSVNARGPFLLVKALLPVMLEKRDGHIINVSSNVIKGGCPNAAAYTASKAAMVGFGESLLHEVAKYGIRVTNVIPGTMNTEQRWDKNPCFPRETVMEPEDLAQAILDVLKLNDYVLVPELVIRPILEED